MTFPEDYTSDNKIQSIGNRLGAAIVRNNTYVDSKIKLESLQLSLPLLLAKIIRQLTFIARGKNEFQNIIDGYNSEHGTAINYEEFSERKWILEVGDEILIPETLRSLVWKLGYDEAQGKQVDILPENIHLLRIIQSYYRAYHESAVLTIDRKGMQNILKNFSNNVSIAVLVQKGILSPTADKNVYAWAYHSEYLQHLGSEIAAVIWDDFGGQEADISNFKEFFKRSLGSGLWPNDLTTYIPIASVTRLRELAAVYARDEKDLQQSSGEFSKMWLDSTDTYRHGMTLLSRLGFSYVDQYSFIESVEAVKELYPGRFDYSGGRKYCLLLLRFLTGSEALGPKRFDSILRTVDSLDTPYILWNLYQESSRLYPELIPFFLKNTDLAPLAFRMIDKIELQGSYFSDAQDKFLSMRESVDTLWNEMFDTFLGLVAQSGGGSRSPGTALARILKDLTGAVFDTGGKTMNATIDHAIYRRRYEGALKKLSLMHSHSKLISEDSRAISQYLPAIADYIGAELSAPKTYHRHLIKMEIALLDLGTEILSLIDSCLFGLAGSASGYGILKSKRDALIHDLYHNVVSYYTIKNIEVSAVDGTKSVSENACRIGKEFGFEILDWGRLILCFEQEKLLDALDEAVINSIEFNKNEDKYERQNLEQAVKLSYYIKSLLLAFQLINNKKEAYELEALPVASAKRKLGELIRKYAIRYSADDIAKGRIDIFNERYSAFGYDRYHEHLANLLYSSIIYFDADIQRKFVSEYFSGNTDISRMLAAINTIKSKELQDIVSKRINELDIDQYVASKFMVTDLEYALVEAVNSENHLDVAESFLGKVQKHYDGKKTKTQQSADFIFEISLLLAFKTKDFTKLNELQIPQRQHGGSDHGNRLKSYYIALYKIYIDKEYDKAIESLRLLLKSEPKNVRWAFHLYRAQTLKAIES